VDGEDKSFRLAGIRGFPKAWAKIVEELRKCVLLCANCHGEVHDGLVQVPKDAARFDERYLNYKAMERREEEKDLCPICGILKPIELITCSVRCAARKSWKVDWDSVDLESLLRKKSIVQIADELNVSDTSVRKRMKKIGLC
jgi:hypothetical protein